MSIPKEFNKLIERDRQTLVAKKQAECCHRHCIIYDHNLMGTCECKDCGKELPIYIHLNYLMEAMEKIVDSKN